MLYKEIIDQYLKAKDKYESLCKEKNKNNSELNDAKIEYLAIETAMLDFSLAMSGVFNDKKKRDYINNIHDMMINDNKKYELKTYDLNYYKFYFEMLDLFLVINKNDFIQIDIFIKQNIKKSDKKANSISNINKVYDEQIRRIESLLNDMYNNKSGKVYVQIGENYNERAEEQRKIYEYAYILIRKAILDGLNTTTSIFEEEFNYSDYDEYKEVLSQEEIDMYYRKTHNTVASLSKKYKNKLQSKIKDKL